MSPIFSPEPKKSVFNSACKIPLSELYPDKPPHEAYDPYKGLKVIRTSRVTTKTNLKADKGKTKTEEINFELQTLACGMQVQVQVSAKIHEKDDPDEKNRPGGMEWKFNHPQPKNEAEAADLGDTIGKKVVNDLKNRILKGDKSDITLFSSLNIHNPELKAIVNKTIEDAYSAEDKFFKEHGVNFFLNDKLIAGKDFVPQEPENTTSPRRPRAFDIPRVPHGAPRPKGPGEK